MLGKNIFFISVCHFIHLKKWKTCGREFLQCIVNRSDSKWKTYNLKQDLIERILLTEICREDNSLAYVSLHVWKVPCKHEGGGLRIVDLFLFCKRGIQLFVYIWCIELSSFGRCLTYLDVYTYQSKIWQENNNKIGKRYIGTYVSQGDFLFFPIYW